MAQVRGLKWYSRALIALTAATTLLATSVAQTSAAPTPSSESTAPAAELFITFQSPRDLILPVPYRSQNDRTLWSISNCGPTSIAMVLEAFGQRVPTQELRDRANVLLGIASPSTGTRMQDLAQILQERGLSTVGPYELDGSKKFRKWTLDEVRQEVREGRPFVPQTYLPLLPSQKGTRMQTDHYIVIVGVEGDDFIFHDPANLRNDGNHLRMTPEEFTRAWGASKFPFGGFSVGPGAAAVPLLPSMQPPVPLIVVQPQPWMGVKTAPAVAQPGVGGNLPLADPVESAERVDGV